MSKKLEKHASPAPQALLAEQRIAGERRQQMIAEAAYYLAEHRGFQGDGALQDWLQAEAEIDHRLGEMPPH